MIRTNAFVTAIEFVKHAVDNGKKGSTPRDRQRQHIYVKQLDGRVLFQASDGYRGAYCEVDGKVYYMQIGADAYIDPRHKAFKELMKECLPNKKRDYPINMQLFGECTVPAYYYKSPCYALRQSPGPVESHSVNSTYMAQAFAAVDKINTDPARAAFVHHHGAEGIIKIRAQTTMSYVQDHLAFVMSMRT